MCGLLGYLPANQLDIDSFTTALNSMFHRGPDDVGVWLSTNHEIALGHRRLSIIDLTNAGHQPFHTLDGRYALVFNGEIYNHLELRQLLANHDYPLPSLTDGASDTSTLFHCLINWGIEKTLERIVGMFAFAFWDNSEKTLILARDRLGEKPLYYSCNGPYFSFSSEIKALTKLPNFSGNISSEAISSYLQLNYFPTPLTLYSNINKLPAGSYLKIAFPFDHRLNLVPTRYWNPIELAEKSSQNQSCCSLDKATDKLEELLLTSISGQLQADVPIGAFLSSGIDSATVVALAQSVQRIPITTFTIGLSDAKLDESHLATRIAKHLHTEQIIEHITEDDVLAYVPMLGQMLDEPLGDSSFLPTYAVCNAARNKLKVALTGDGADEIFLGYHHHRYLSRLWSLTRIAKPIIPLFSNLLTGKAAHSILPRASSILNLLALPPDQYLDKITDLYRGINHPMGSHASTWHYNVPWVENMERTAGLRDTVGYLTDDILTKVDVAAMKNRLETRCPMLDHRIIEYSYTLPANFLYSNGQGKVILRNLLSRYLPPHLINGKKKGFSIPIESWLRNELKTWGNECMAKLIERRDLFNPDALLTLWKDHLKLKANHSQRLWGLFTLSLFL